MAAGFWHGWSVRARLLSIIIVPVAYMFVTFVAYAWQSRQAEVRDELAERGPLVAKVLADSSEYSISVGKLDELKLGVTRMVQSDSSIYRVEVFDKARRPLLQVGARGAGQPEEDGRHYEAPVLRRLVWMNMQTGTPGPGGLTVETVGHVRVTMSPTAMLHKQTRRFYVALLVASLGLLVCALLAWHLARHFNHALQVSVSALREADAEKRRLIRQVNSAVEEERKSIALEIHDELNASLIAVRLEAQRIVDLARRVEQAPGLEHRQAQEPDREQGRTQDDGRADGQHRYEEERMQAAREIGTRAQGVIRLALDLYNSGRTLVRRLRPEVLEMLGLQGAIEEMVRHHDRAQPAPGAAAAASGCRFTFHADGDFSTLDNAAAISAYRIVQEALSNVVKHARATRASVALARVARAGAIPGQGDALRITIADNGRGYDPAQTPAGIGLVGMRERVDAFGGAIAVDTGHAGTAIVIHLPLPA